MSFRYRFRSIFADFLKLLDSDKSDLLQFKEIEYKIKRYCELYNIKFLGNEETNKKKRGRKHGK